MELRVLEYFLALTREGSVSAAAESLHLSQPTLSRQLMDLERELGTTLFTRGRHGVTLTEDGMLLRRRAQEIVDLSRITVAEIAQNRGVVEGEVRIGCAETRAMDVLARIMNGLQGQYPGVTFGISSGIAEDVAERINRGLLDFGLLLRVRDQWGFHSIKLPTAERGVVIMRRDSPLAARQTVTLDDLAEVPMLLPASFHESGILGGELPQSEGGRLNVTATFDMPYNASRMVLAGMGCAITLEGLLDLSASPELTSRALEVQLDMPSYLVWKPLQLRTRACEAFLAAARAELEDEK